MTPEQFCYWLQGFVESDGDLPSERQWKSINAHLQTVFKKVTPQAGPSLDLGKVLQDRARQNWPVNPEIDPSYLQEPKQPRFIC